MENKDIILKNEEAPLTELLYRAGVPELELPVLPQPFERDIFLYGTNVAGTNFVEEIEQIARDLELGEKVFLFREPDNPYDDRAILVKDAEGRKIGYVPRDINLILSRLMDAGKELYATVRVNEKDGDYRNIVIKIYMHE